MASTLTIQASEHPIKSVTVFKSSKAEVVRLFTLNLKKGQNKIGIRGLPSTIDTHSVRVSGLGDARLFDVVCTVGTNKAASYEPSSSSEVIRTLRTKQTALESEKAVREMESQLLLKYAQTLSGEHVTPTQMSQFLESYVAQGRKTVEDVSKLNEQLVEISRRIEAETEKVASKRGAAFGKVDVVVVAEEENSVELKLTYIVSNAQWNPTYELHATTESGKPSSSVSLHYRARVTQGTGEDWSNTALTLSTVASDTVVKRIPQLKPVKVLPRTGNSLFTKKGFANNTNVVPIQNNPFTNGIPWGQQQQQPQYQQQQQPQQQPSLRPFQSQSNNFFPLPQQQAQASLFGGPQAAFGATQSQSNNFFPLPQQQARPSLFGAPQAAFGATQSSGLFGASAPNPPPAVHINPATVQQQLAELSLADAHPLPEDDDFEDLEGPGAITEPTTVVSETPMAISFSVHGESTIPSDGVEHQVSVAVLPFQAKISYISIPRIDPRVFLQCEVQNSSEYRLLPGPVSVILDDSYVSKTSINDINTGDNFECTLGDDTSTKVTYARSSKTVKSTGGAFSEVTNTTTYTTKVSIHNKHQFAIADLIVRDVIPTCEDKRAKIILRKPIGLADAKDGESIDLKNDGLRVGWETLVDGKGGEKEGKFEWKWKVGSGAKVNLEAEWEIKVPGEFPWAEAH